ncbi:MAG: hypothetical protein V4478_01755 [Patescibacteria group bacterium]
MESFLQPQNTPENTPKDETSKEQLPAGYEQKKAFAESWMNAATALGFEARESEDGKVVLEKNGQTIKLTHNLNPSGNISGFAAFEYPDAPLIKMSSMAFSHEKEIGDMSVKKTLETILKKYETRYDKQIEKHPEYKKFNDALIALSQEQGYAFNQKNLGRIVIETNDAVIKIQHMPHHPSNGPGFVSSIEIVRNGESSGAISAIEWNGSDAAAVVSEQAKAWGAGNVEKEHFYPSLEVVPVTRPQVLDALKKRGFEDGDVVDLIAQYIEQTNVPPEPFGPLNDINASIITAQLYKDAGYSHEAWETLNDSIDAAVGIGDMMLVEQIKGMMDAIDSES